MTPADWTPSGILVSGIIESDTEAIAEALEVLGCSRLTHTKALDDLGRRVLETARGSWESPPPVSPSELRHLGATAAEEARRLLRDARGLEQEEFARPWVWADPRHSLLTPFWASALAFEPAIVHVHRDAHSSVSALVHTLEIDTDSALRLWERTNRAALASCAQFPSIVVGQRAFADDHPVQARVLVSFLDSLVAPSDTRDVAAASAVIKAWTSRPVAPAEAHVLLTPAHEVLDEVLSSLEAEDQTSLDGERTNQTAYDHLSEFYDADYYHEYDGGVAYTRSEPQWIRFFGEMADNIVAQIAPTTAFDAGCAIGMLVEALRDRGVEASGMDLSPWAIGQVPERIRPYCRVGSITEPIDGHYDLITCIEVLEHLPASDANPVIGNLCSHADAVLFSSTSDEFDDPTHLNVETTGYWAELFASHGFYRDFDHDATAYLSPHAILFRKSAAPTPDLVSEYERALWDMRQAYSAAHRALEAGWRGTAERAEDLEHLLESQYTLVADERTVQALEGLVAPTDLLHSLVRGPAVVGESNVSDEWAADDYSRWRASRISPTAPLSGPCFSIVVPVFNPVAEQLTACISSVRAQTYDNWELVLVDVSTAPHVRPICERFAALDSRVRTVRREPRHRRKHRRWGAGERWRLGRLPRPRRCVGTPCPRIGRAPHRAKS